MHTICACVCVCVCECVCVRLYLYTTKSPIPFSSALWEITSSLVVRSWLRNERSCVCVSVCVRNFLSHYWHVPSDSMWQQLKYRYSSLREGTSSQWWSGYTLWQNADVHILNNNFFSTLLPSPLSPLPPPLLPAAWNHRSLGHRVYG